MFSGLMELFQTVQDMQEKLNKVHETALQLAAEKEGRHTHMNVSLKNIEHFVRARDTGVLA